MDYGAAGGAGGPPNETFRNLRISVAPDKSPVVKDRNHAEDSPHWRTASEIVANLGVPFVTPPYRNVVALLAGSDVYAVPQGIDIGLRFKGNSKMAMKIPKAAGSSQMIWRYSNEAQVLFYHYLRTFPQLVNAVQNGQHVPPEACTPFNNTNGFVSGLQPEVVEAIADWLTDVVGLERRRLPGDFMDNYFDNPALNTSVPRYDTKDDVDGVPVSKYPVETGETTPGRTTQVPAWQGDSFYTPPSPSYAAIPTIATHPPRPSGPSMAQNPLMPSSPTVGRVPASPTRGGFGKNLSLTIKDEKISMAEQAIPVATGSPRHPIAPIGARGLAGALSPKSPHSPTVASPGRGVGSSSSPQYSPVSPMTPMSPSSPRKRAKGQGVEGSDSGGSVINVVGDHCKQVITPEVNVTVTAFLAEMARLQRRADAGKSGKKRLVIGLREVLKSVKRGQTVCVVFAPEIEGGVRDGLGDLVAQIIDVAAAQNVPIIFALTRSDLSKALAKSGQISCVGATDCQGAEALLGDMVRAADVAREAWVPPVTAAAAPATAEATST